jgi:hypothetical protein
MVSFFPLEKLNLHHYANNPFFHNNFTEKVSLFQKWTKKCPFLKTKTLFETINIHFYTRKFSLSIIDSFVIFFIILS